MSGLVSSLQGALGNVQKSFFGILDKILPPEKRAEILAKLQDFAMNNPKLAAFLTTQIVLTGFPLVLFITFSITVFLFSLIAALLIGLLAAVLFTLFMVGVALIVVLPTIFMTTFAATFVFLWGLGGYYLLKWFNEGDVPAPDGTALGDKINNLTGGRMSWLMDGARKTQDDKHTGVDKTPKTHGSDSDGERKAPRKLEHSNGSANGSADSGKQGSQAKGTATEQADGVKKRAANSTGNTSNATETAKSAADGT